jgi:hypothetical protein
MSELVNYNVSGYFYFPTLYIYLYSPKPTYYKDTQYTIYNIYIIYVQFDSF